MTETVLGSLPSELLVQWQKIGPLPDSDSSEWSGLGWGSPGCNLRVKEGFLKDLATSETHSFSQSAVLNLWITEAIF